jgi:hypothetical protein
MLFIYVFLFSLFKEADIFSDYTVHKFFIIIEQFYGEGGEENGCGLV